MSLLRNGLMAALFIAALFIRPSAALAGNISVNIKGTFTQANVGACATGYTHQCASGSCGNVVAVGTDAGWFSKVAADMKREARSG